MTSNDLRTYTFGPASGKAPESIVILLHGLGANGEDLLGLAPYFAQAMPDTIFVSPDAPFPCDMAPFGFQWFSMQDSSFDSLLAGIKKAAPVLNDFIAQQLETYGLAADRLVLLGFSQGTMMSLYVAPRYPEKIAGVLAYSGALLWEQGTDIGSLQKVPVHLIHGDADSIVPVEAYHHAKDILKGAGFPVSGSITEGLAHGIDEDGMQAGAAFLQRTLR